MPKNKHGGNKHKRKKNSTPDTENLPLILKEQDQEYGKIIRSTGGCTMLVKCADNVERLCMIRGGIKKKFRFFVDDCVLISLRTFQDSRGDIIHKYESDDVRKLIKLELVDADFKTKTVDTNKEMTEEQEYEAFEFEDI
jgi:translation initiation factor 1A